jgi:catechol 2,3-dioxygenase-like lactoylglutathione lyase family enzyme
MLGVVTTFSGFSVDDAAKAKEFYVEKLGLKLTSEEMGLDFDLPGNGALFIYEKPDHVPATFTVLNFVVSDINAAVDEMVGKGVVFERYDNMPAPQDERGIIRGIAANQGPDIAWFKDPAGNVLSIIQTA